MALSMGKQPSVEQVCFRSSSGCTVWKQISSRRIWRRSDWFADLASVERVCRRAICASMANGATTNDGHCWPTTKWHDRGERRARNLTALSAKVWRTGSGVAWDACLLPSLLKQWQDDVPLAVPPRALETADPPVGQVVPAIY